MKNVIELRNVKKIYKMDHVNYEVLKGINLSIKTGESVAILGASGSGKTTLLNMIGVLDRPTHGKVLIDGKDISKLDDNELAILRGKKIGFVFQFFYLVPSLTCLKNVELPMTFRGKPDEKKAKSLLKLLGLGHRMDYYPGKLSGGERQRVAMARALINDPEVILADEPTGNLDSKTGKEIIDIFFDLNKKKKITLVIVTHDKSITSKANRIIYIKDGKIIKRGKR